MSKPSKPKLRSPRVTREELGAWAHKMGPILQRDFVLDLAILGMLANWCQCCEDKHPVAPLLEYLLIALCDGDKDQVYQYVDGARCFAKTLEVSLKELFRGRIPVTDLDEILRENNIDLARNNQTKRNQNDD